LVNNSYVSGSNFEREVKHYYERSGYTAARTAGSHGPFDVVAWKIDAAGCCQMDVVQCKKENKKLKYTEDIEGLRNVPCEASWRRLLYVKRKGRVEILQVFAESTKLIDEFPTKLLKRK